MQYTSHPACCVCVCVCVWRRAYCSLLDTSIVMSWDLNTACVSRLICTCWAMCTGRHEQYTRYIQLLAAITMLLLQGQALVCDGLQSFLVLHLLPVQCSHRQSEWLSSLIPSSQSQLSDSYGGGLGMKLLIESIHKHSSISHTHTWHGREKTA